MLSAMAAPSVKDLGVEKELGQGSRGGSAS